MMWNLLRLTGQYKAFNYLVGVLWPYRFLIWNIDFWFDISFWFDMSRVSAFGNKRPYIIILGMYVDWLKCWFLNKIPVALCFISNLILNMFWIIANSIWQFNTIIWSISLLWSVYVCYHYKFLMILLIGDRSCIYTLMRNSYQTRGTMDIVTQR